MGWNVVGNIRGPEGKSAYQLWLDDGNTGTVQDFLDSLAAGGVDQEAVQAVVDAALDERLGSEPPTHRIQQLNLFHASGGTFTLSFGGQTTAPITRVNDSTMPGSCMDALQDLSSTDSYSISARQQYAGTIFTFDTWPDVEQIPDLTIDASGLVSDGQPVEASWIRSDPEEPTPATTVDLQALSEQLGNQFAVAIGQLAEQVNQIENGGGGGGITLPSDGHLVYGMVDQYPYSPLGALNDIIVLADVEGVRFIRIGEQLNQNSDMDNTVETNHPWQVTSDGGVTVTDVTTSSTITVPVDDGSSAKYVRRLADFSEIQHNLGLRAYVTSHTGDFAVSTLQVRIGLYMTGLSEVFGADPILYLLDPGGITYTPQVITRDGSYVLIESQDGAALTAAIQAFKTSVEASYEGSNVDVQGLWLVAPLIDQAYDVQVIGRFDTSDREKTTTVLQPSMVLQLSANLGALQASVADLQNQVNDLIAGQ